MKHIPYGYRIKNGEIVIDEFLSEKVKKLFDLYLEGYPLVKSGKLAGIEKCHGSISRILSNKKYLGELGYPQIISKEIFEAAQVNKREKAKKLGRDSYKEKLVTKEISTSFYYRELTEKFDNPFQEAECKYDLIFIEVS